MTDIIRMKDRRVRNILERKKKRKETVAQLSAWEEIKKLKYGSIPARMVHDKPVINAREFLFDGAWKGKRCFIVGGGPSLEGFNFDSLGQELTIAVNRAFEYINPSVILWMDYLNFYTDLLAGKFGDKALKKFELTRSLKASLNISGYDYPDEVWSIPRTTGGGPLSMSLKDGLADGDNVGYLALNLAVCLGANPIYLLGFDMKGDRAGKQAWFHSGYKNVGSDKAYERFAGNFKKAAPIIKKLGIDVINLNPKSELKCFEFGKIEDVKDLKGQNLYLSGPNGFGDNFYLRSLIKHLAKRYKTIYIRTAAPEVYWDIPNVKFVYSNQLELRTQLKHVKKYHKKTWVKVPPETKELPWSACLPVYRQRAHQIHLVEERSVTEYIQEENNIEDFDFSFPLKKEWLDSAKKIIRSLDNKGKKICIIRPPTVRKEWPAESRNPKVEYIQLLINKYKKEYYFISIADLEKDKEWLEGNLTGIDKKFHHGELSITTIFSLIKLTDIMIAYPGFFALVAIAVRSKCFCIFGGLQTAEHLFNKNMGLENFEYITPHPFCNCYEMSHKCNKEIPEEKIIERFEELKNRKKHLKKVTVGMPSGIADMHWIMTKMESFKEKNCIDKLEVVIFPDHGHTESPAFLKLIPFIDSVKFRKDPYKFTFSIVGMSGNPIHEDRQGVDYLMEFNSRLEEGVRLENIVPKYKTNFYYHLDYPLESKKFANRVKMKVGGKIYLIYASSIGSNDNWARETWGPADWMKLINKIVKTTGRNPVLIGKDWDLDYTKDLMELDKNKIIYNLVAKTDIKQALALIREANVIVGFLSGLPLIATYFKTPTVTFWPIKGITPSGKFIKEFQTSCVPPEAVSSGRYIPFIYGEEKTTPENVFNSIKEFL